MRNHPLSIAVSDNSKPHYYILDGLRGVAALMVLCFHIFEGFATSHLDQIVNHGYLAVDFFFILSGFVVGYAYNDRWGKMTTSRFFLRRIIRLHPMVVMGAVIGGVLFYTQACGIWHDVSAVSIGALLVATLLNACLIPVTPAAEIRGLGEMFPLNGPGWSLFFEYIGNILYALFIRRLSTKALAVWVALVGCGLGILAIAGPQGDVSTGWQLTGSEFMGGSLRMLFSFSAGLFLSRIFRPGGKVGGAFWICTPTIILLLAMPRLGGAEHLWINGVYDILCCAAIFPLLVFIGARGKEPGRFTARICRFLGNISYPLYMVHYPFMYTYYAWVKNQGLTFAQSLPGALGVVAVSILLAWLCLRFYDMPIRRRLTARLAGKE